MSTQANFTQKVFYENILEKTTEIREQINKEQEKYEVMKTMTLIILKNKHQNSEILKNTKNWKI